MDKRINWDPDYDFAMLSMMQHFSDGELQNQGLGPQDIIKYRAYEKCNEEKMTERTETDQNQVNTH